MDAADPLFLDAVYAKLSPGWMGADRSDMTRQFISLYLIVLLGGTMLYLFFSGLDWFFIFDRTYMKHPKILKDQVRREMGVALASIPLMSLLTAFVFLAEVRGYSKLRDEVGSWQEEAAGIGLFLVFTDFWIYWIHRGLHHPLVYPTIHKTHHLWKVPTPWASHAFHPLDGFAQSTPYHLFVFLHPMNKLVYLVMFVFVNCWTISIHDGYFVSKDGFLNSCAHHSEHHLHFTCNYGQYFTLWDRMFGTHKSPDFANLDPKSHVKAS